MVPKVLNIFRKKKANLGMKWSFVPDAPEQHLLYPHGRWCSVVKESNKDRLGDCLRQCNSRRGNPDLSQDPPPLLHHPAPSIIKLLKKTKGPFSLLHSDKFLMDSSKRILRVLAAHLFLFCSVTECCWI